MNRSYDRVHEEHDRTDGRGTSGTVSAGGEPEWSGGRWASGAADPTVGGGPYLGADPGQIELQRCVYRPLEQTVWAGATGGAVQPPCRARPAQQSLQSTRAIHDLWKGLDLP